MQEMKAFLRPNLEPVGRKIRAGMGITLLLGGVAACFWSVILGVALLGSAAFVLFEATRGWCIMRACGIKTRY